MSIHVPTSEQRFRLSLVSWEKYEQMAAWFEDRHCRLTYDRGELEIMTVGHPGLGRLKEEAGTPDEIADILRNAIIDRVFPPGHRLLQTELAERFGVSRIPLREAIRTLEEDEVTAD